MTPLRGSLLARQHLDPYLRSTLDLRWVGEGEWLGVGEGEWLGDVCYCIYHDACLFIPSRTGELKAVKRARAVL